MGDIVTLVTPLFRDPVMNGSLTVVLVLAAVGSLILVALSLVAYRRKRSRSYLLITLAFTTLFARTALGSLVLLASFPPDYHLVLDHGLDVVMIGFVIAAVYYARPVGGDNHER